MHPYRIMVDGLKMKDNLLEVEVTNLSANRTRDLDRRKIAWRNFFDANVVNIRFKPFDASDWPVFDSGLLGPVNYLPSNREHVLSVHVTIIYVCDNYPLRT